MLIILKIQLSLRTTEVIKLKNNRKDLQMSLVLERTNHREILQETFTERFLSVWQRTRIISCRLPVTWSRQNVDGRHRVEIVRPRVCKWRNEALGESQKTVTSSSSNGHRFKPGWVSSPSHANSRKNSLSCRLTPMVDRKQWSCSKRRRWWQWWSKMTDS